MKTVFPQSYIGVQLARVLVTNKITPILIIAFTNHALDHLVHSILEAGISKNVIRLGSRSNDPLVAARSLEELEKDQQQSRLDPSIGRAYRAIKVLEEEMTKLSERITSRSVPSFKIQSLLEYNAVDHFDSLIGPPPWISTLYESASTDEGEGWIQADGGRQIRTHFDFWFQGKDIEFLQASLEVSSPPLPEVNTPRQSNRFQNLTRDPDIGQEDVADASDDEGTPLEPVTELDPTRLWTATAAAPSARHAEDGPVPAPPHLSNSIDHLRFFHGSELPNLPTGDRDITELMEDSNVWSMARSERRRLGQIWIEHARMQGHEVERAEFERLRTMHKEAQERYNNLKDEVRTYIRKALLVH